MDDTETVMALMATITLMKRAGADDVEFGFLEHGGPVERAGWWAQTSRNGTRVIVEKQPSPCAAADALACKVIDGGRCTHCGQPISLDDDIPGCRWRREGDRWQWGCAAPPLRPWIPVYPDQDLYQTETCG